jgi:hypothetical protein
VAHIRDAIEVSIFAKGLIVYTGEYLTDKVGFTIDSSGVPEPHRSRKIAFEMHDPAAIAPAALTT